MACFRTAKYCPRKESSTNVTIRKMLNAGKIRLEHNLYLVNQEGE